MFTRFEKVTILMLFSIFTDNPIDFIIQVELKCKRECSSGAMSQKKLQREIDKKEKLWITLKASSRYLGTF